MQINLEDQWAHLKGELESLSFVMVLLSGYLQL